jgi:hypothetical protein
MAMTPEQSGFTSIQRRIKAVSKGEQPIELLPFLGSERQHMPKGLMFELQDYLELVDETGRVIRDDKRGAISATANNILNRLNIPADTWMKIVAEFSALFHGPVGTLQEFSSYCAHLSKRRRHFSNSCQCMQTD